MRFSKPKSLKERIYNLLQDDNDNTSSFIEDLKCENGSGDYIRSRMGEERFKIVNKIINEMKEANTDVED